MNYFKNENRLNKFEGKRKYKERNLYLKEYAKYSTHQRVLVSAEKAAGKGTDGHRWWIEKWLKNNPATNAFKV